jgi:hypothetical protein
MLKKNGLVGVVQHRTPATATEEWADGNKGYLNEAAVITIFPEAHRESNIRATGTATEELLACPMSVASAVGVLIRKTGRG